MISVEGTRLDRCTVAIHGLGLMGGSLGRALEGKVRRRIGIVPDDDIDAADIAVELGAVDEVTTMSVAVPAADIVVMALPVREIVEQAPHVAMQMVDGAVLTDLGSTKQAIVRAMERAPGGVHAIGGHPMCGRHTPGIAHADPELFRGARWVLCPTSRTDARAQGLVESLVRGVGAEPVTMDADVHDRAVAVSSHLPYVVAQALVHAIAAAERRDGIASSLAATGFAGATRLASGDVRMWGDILLTNEDAVRAAMRMLEDELSQMRLRFDDHDALVTWLAQGQAEREAMRLDGP